MKLVLRKGAITVAADFASDLNSRVLIVVVSAYVVHALEELAAEGALHLILVLLLVSQVSRPAIEGPVTLSTLWRSPGLFLRSCLTGEGLHCCPVLQGDQQRTFSALVAGLIVAVVEVEMHSSTAMPIEFKSTGITVERSRESCPAVGLLQDIAATEDGSLVAVMAASTGGLGDHCEEGRTSSQSSVEFRRSGTRRGCREIASSEIRRSWHVLRGRSFSGTSTASRLIIS